jgi:hypothetical protein
MRISTIYKVINDVDDKVYIGSTTCGLSKRIGDHRYKVRLGNQSKFYNHMREIGVEHFKILCIKQYTDISKERLRTKEQKYINRYDAINNGLNTFTSLTMFCHHNKRRTGCIEFSPAVCENCKKTYAGKDNLKKNQKKCPN